MNKMLKLKIIIIGAGLGGLALAIALRREGHEVIILEAAKKISEVGAGIQISPNSSRLLIKWGMGSELKAKSVTPNEFTFLSYKDGKVLSRLNLMPYVEKIYGSPYWHIHRADYHKIMLDHAIAMGAVLREDSRVTKIDPDAAEVIIKGEEVLRGDLIIGADGLHSISRETILGHTDPPRRTGDLAYRIILDTKEMIKHDLLLPLVEEKAISYWLGPGGHVVGYNLRGCSLYNIVVICPDNMPEDARVAEGTVEEMQTIFKNWSPQLRALLSIPTSVNKWKLVNLPELSTWTHPSSKLVLLGDACHPTLPYLAQGAAMAIEDGAVLGGLLGKIQSTSQIPDVLKIYENMRKPRTTRVVNGSTLYQTIFHMKDGPEQEERDHKLLTQKPCKDDNPNQWARPSFQKWLWSYDADAEVDLAWEKYTKAANGTRS